MRRLFWISLVLGLAALNLAPRAGRAQKEADKEPLVVVKGEDFPIREGPEGLRDTKDEIKRKLEACKAKYQDKQVKVVGLVFKRPGAKDTPQLYTLRLTFPVKRRKQYFSGSQDVDVIPAKPAPELHQPSRSGLIAAVVGRGHVSAEGRLLLKEARVLATNIPPG